MVLTPGLYPGSKFQLVAQTVLGIYLKRTCSRVTSASNALGVLNDYVLYKSTHSLTHFTFTFNPTLGFSTWHTVDESPKFKPNQQVH